MASRHLSRSHVLQTLFECDAQASWTSENARAILKRNIQDFTEGDADESFAEALLEGVLAKKEEIDGVITASAPQWPIDKIASIDRNVLRIGLFELLFGDRAAVPPKVALNEAIELAKTYGGDTSGKFVNGVLGTVFRDIGSPGKDEAPKDTAPLPHEHLGGVFLAASDNGTLKVALVLDAFDRWTLPKAKCAEGELSDAAAKRVLKDELGVETEMKQAIGEHEYIAHEPETGRVVRTVGYFLALLPEPTKLSSKASAGIKEARWFSEEELGTMRTYADLEQVLTAGVNEAKRLIS